MKQLTIIVVCLPLFASCDTLNSWAESSLDPTEQAYFDSYSASAEIQDQKILDLEAEITETLSSVRDLREIGAIESRMNEVRELQVEHASAVKAYEDVAGRANRVLTESLASKGGGFLSMIDPFVPIPLQPLIPLLSSAAVLVMSKRGRKHAGKGIRHALSGNVGELVASVFRAVGAKHSNTNPTKILGGAIAEARIQVIKGELPQSVLTKLEEAHASLESHEE